MSSSREIFKEHDDSREGSTVDERPPPLTPLQELERASGYRWAALDGDLDPPTYFPPQAVN
jgi:hypothetical protein